MSVSDEMASGYYTSTALRSSRVRVGPSQGRPLGFDVVVNPLAALFWVHETEPPAAVDAGATKSPRFNWLLYLHRACTPRRTSLLNGSGNAQEHNERWVAER